MQVKWNHTIKLYIVDCGPIILGLLSHTVLYSDVSFI